VIKFVSDFWQVGGFLYFELTTLVVICTDCTDNCKSNYHAITATTALGSRQVIIAYVDAGQYYYIPYDSGTTGPKYLSCN
jgi:hypothetical protein